ncbi:MAG TPA: hypothetical protein VM553_09285, partial [Dongiaceae bacterium]|nr:hypothetical protein [Dongiaceae bacterium]
MKPTGPFRPAAALLFSALATLSTAPPTFAATDLLGSSRGGSPQWDFCYGKPDNTLLPQDPRSLVLPGVNTGKAVHFNAFWKDCHTDPTLVDEEGAAQTCGELRNRFYRGDAVLDTGGPGAGALFAGTDPNSLASAFGISTFTAAQYNSLWTIWGGFLLRPSNFDQLVAERYGSGFSTTRNPYPKPGEDPNRTNGGTGQLPEIFTQLRNANGSWSGRIGVTCHGCHSGVVGATTDGAGLGLAYGGGSSLADLDLLLRDMLPLGYPASLATFANLSRHRGTNNASDINLAFLFPESGFYSPLTLAGLITSGSTASMDTPPWWNLGHRPVKFTDGVFPSDAPRTDMVFYTPFTGLFGAVGGPVSDQGQEWMKQHGPALNTWIESLKAPKYPFTVNTTLAETGAQLFHTLDLWAPSRNNPVPKPQGNGSCAGCHGAYAPRYVNNPAYLDTPALAGIASYIVPMNIIKTDAVRVNTNNQAVQQAGAVNFFGYPELNGTANYCGPQNRPSMNGNRAPGYLAPPLYGVW